MQFDAPASPAQQPAATLPQGASPYWSPGTSGHVVAPAGTAMDGSMDASVFGLAASASPFVPPVAAPPSEALFLRRVDPAQDGAEGEDPR